MWKKNIDFFQGLDLNLEYPGTRDADLNAGIRKDDYTQLIRDLSFQLRSNSLQVRTVQ